MPQADDKLRELMGRWFGDEVDLLYGPLQFIKSRGYIDRAGMLMPPVPSHRVSYEEGAVIDFLCDEWDFGFAGTTRPAYA